LSVSGKLTGTLSGFITRVKPAPFGLLWAWREVSILRQQSLQLALDFIKGNSSTARFVPDFFHFW
jgi:hypothetical protein